MLNSLASRMIANSFLFLYWIFDALVVILFLIIVGKTITGKVGMLLSNFSVKLLKCFFEGCRELFQSVIDGKRSRSFLFLFCRYSVTRLIFCSLVLRIFSHHLSVLAFSVRGLVFLNVSHAYMAERAQSLERLWHVWIFWVCLWRWRSFLVDRLQGASKSRLFLLLLELGFNLQAQRS